MNCVNFNTESPLEHIPRVLDVLRVMNMDLNDIQMGERENGTFYVTLTCIPAALKDLHTLSSRIKNIPGIQKFHCV